jgi:hypothetical protein
MYDRTPSRPWALQFRLGRIRHSRDGDSEPNALDGIYPYAESAEELVWRQSIRYWLYIVGIDDPIL